ncbi:NFACT family protein, partial [Paenibacillus sp. MCAF20]
MALDGIVTRAITHDLQRCIGARIHKIHQPTEHELVLSIRGAGVQGKLLLSANPTYPRVHWTTSSYLNPMEAPMFCMLLRKYCESGIIEGIRQIDNERVIHIDVKHRDELGDISVKTIIIEIMGRHSNIILVDPATQTIHDGIHHVTPSISSYRIVMPGSNYTPPPDQSKTNPFVINSEEQFREAYEHTTEGSAAGKRLVEAFSGLSPLIAKEIAYRAGTEAEDTGAIWRSFESFIGEMRAHRYSPVIKTDETSGKMFFSVTELTHINGVEASYPAVSECLQAFFGDKAQRDTVKQRAADLIRFVQNEKAKNISKITKLEDTLVEAKDAEKYRVLG